MASVMTEPFKTCPCCHQVWSGRETFLADGLLTLNGYQADFDQPGEGLFIFTHMKKDCGSSMALRTGSFKDLYNGSVYTDKKLGEIDCPGYCLGEYNLERCDARCEYANIRELLQIIKKWPKKRTAA